MKTKAVLLVLSLPLFGVITGTTVGLVQQEIQLLIVDNQPKEIKLPKPDFAVYNQYGLMVYHNELKTVLADHPPDYIYTLRERVRKRAEELLYQGQVIYKLPQKPLAYIRYGEISNCAATAHNTDFGIYINEILFIRHPDEFIDKIIPHEIAHLIHYQLHGDGDFWHLSEYHDIMKSLVGFSMTYHEMDVQPVCDFLYELLKAQAKLHPCDNCTLIMHSSFCKEEMVANVYQHKILEPPYEYVVEELQ